MASFDYKYRADFEIPCRFRGLPSMAALAKSTHRRFLSNMAQGLFSGLSVSAYNRLAQIAMHAAAARTLGSVKEYGVFALCVGSIHLVALLAALGWHPIITRLVAQYDVQQDWGRLQGAMWRAFQITVSISVVIAVVALLVAPWLTIPDVYRQCLIISSICLPMKTIKRLRFCELLGFHRTNIAMFLEDGAVPTIVILLAMTMRPHNAAEVVLWYTLSSALLAGVMSWVLHRAISRPAVETAPRFKTQTWFRFALPAVLGQSGAIVMQRSDILMIAPMLGASAVGIYSSAARISVALACIPLAISAIMRPRFATAYYANDLPNVRKLFYFSLAISTCLAIPIALLLILFPEQITSMIFGAEYKPAATFLLVLVIGQTVNAITGPVAALLMMTGREKIAGVTFGVAALLNIVGNLIAIPRWGIMGAAVSTALALIIRNGLQMLAVLRQLNPTDSDDYESLRQRRSSCFRIS
jgi:O-antigen/teichoic acid export membrane protein